MKIRKPKVRNVIRWVVDLLLIFVSFAFAYAFPHWTGGFESGTHFCFLVPAVVCFVLLGIHDTVFREWKARKIARIKKRR